MLHRKKLAKDLFLHFDWIGLALFSGGLAVFIFGLNWGGVLYVMIKLRLPRMVTDCHLDIHGGQQTL
jgi:hypothetical protein